MIKTFINRHDLEYFLYAMVKAFYKEAQILPPDIAEHNKPVDDEMENEDVIECKINDSSFFISFNKGKWFSVDQNYQYDVDTNLDDTVFKDLVRGYIYDALSDYSESALPWGNLTGIRPTKLYLQKLKANAIEENIEFDSVSNKEKVCSDMKNTYRVSDSKNIIGADIAILEEKIINSVHGVDGYSVYIGIPFCPSTCLYCSFTSNPIFTYKNRISEYLECLKKELVATASIMKDYKLDTIYIGGGTPTSLEAKELDILLNDIISILPMENVKEFTVEAGRADSITKDKLEVLRKYPVTRISVNPQTMQDKTLKLIGRHHTAKEAKEAFLMAREMGFDNINMDIILGLPGENVEDVQYTLNEIASLCPESLTVHSLAIKRASRLKEYIDANGIVCNMNLDEAMNEAINVASKIELKPYYLYRQKDMAGNLENTGFAKEGKYGIYNILMMEEVQSIVAIGAGSVTKRVFEDGHIERCDTAKDVNLYIDRIDEMIERKRKLFS